MMEDQVSYILGLPAVRENAHIILQAAREGKLNHFDYHADKLSDTADYVIGMIQRDFGPDRYDQIPPHGRWQHFEVGNEPRVSKLLDCWIQRGYDDKEKVRGLVDLFFVSVLLDAGAGDRWRFKEQESGQEYSRSEGIAVVSLHMFLNGDFAKEGERKDIVQSKRLAELGTDVFEKGFQVSESNPIVGISSRAETLRKLGESMLSLPEIYGQPSRPGNLVDYLYSKAEDGQLNYEILWSALQKTLIPIWPSDRTKVGNQSVGDAWPLQVLVENNPSKTEISGIQPFHKLTQWLAYSLMVPFTRLLGVTWRNAHLGTGLPEYRNGGLFIDTGVLTLKPDALAQGLRNAGAGNALPSFFETSDTIVEWRALTVALLDELHKHILTSPKLGGVRLTLPQVLEAGSWKSGRELAAAKRPETRSSPIGIEGSGTLF